ncbi:MAG: 3-dehydroquinate synthase [Lachnospiraceae bacterium]|nr:3-dehydroquinate synthase [Lachnospiraceae bacterium]MDY4970295.1 3-dehydroquinate synthase [Lachnospiraceae bacterium]
MITVHYDGKPIYNIHIEESYNGLQDALKTLKDTDKKKVCIVSETNVAPLYLEAVRQVTEKCFASVTDFVFQAGEAHKNLNTVQELYEHLILHHFERGDMLIALGGGVTGDLTGYAAATYLRGISFIQMPTTLLSQVDSSIGGKTGVDFKSYKNMVGAFHQPSMVYINLNTLKTLSDKQYCEGMGEIIKHGLIKDGRYYQWLSDHMDQILARDFSVCREMIAVSCNIKREVVERDPKEKGERALLNFGHTLGHAVEKVSDFRLLHGECVALGCVAASWISWQRGMISEEQYLDIRDTIQKSKLPVTADQISKKDAMEAVKHDKKMEAGKVKFILLEQPGKAVIDRSVSPQEMEAALNVILTGGTDEQ